MFNYINEEDWRKQYAEKMDPLSGDIQIGTWVILKKKDELDLACQIQNISFGDKQIIFEINGGALRELIVDRVTQRCTVSGDGDVSEVDVKFVIAKKNPFALTLDLTKERLNSIMCSLNRKISACKNTSSDCSACSQHDTCDILFLRDKCWEVLKPDAG
jgi:hypothetical protein